MPINADTLMRLVEQELTGVSDTRVVEHIRELLVPPSIVLYDWDYGPPGQQYPCWMVLSDAEHSGTEIGYSEYGFGPRCPWGLLGGIAKNRSMGMDSGWFPTFLEAFFESAAVVRLPIWKVFTIAKDVTRTPLTDEGLWETTWKRIDELRSADPTIRYDCDRSILARSVR